MSKLPKLCTTSAPIPQKRGNRSVPNTQKGKEMKYLIASDIHGSAYWCSKLLEAYVNEHADRLVLLGDILYHGPRNDLPNEYAPKEVARMLNAHKAEILAVRGNCEAEVDQLMLEFPVMAEYAVLDIACSSIGSSTDGNPAVSSTIYLTHGHHINIDNPLPIAPGGAIIYGHTHLPLDETRNGIRFLNPGSVSLPKNGTPHGYLVLENGVFTAKTLG